MVVGVFGADRFCAVAGAVAKSILASTRAVATVSRMANPFRGSVKFSFIFFSVCEWLDSGKDHGITPVSLIAVWASLLLDLQTGSAVLTTKVRRILCLEALQLNSGLRKSGLIRLSS